MLLSDEIIEHYEDNIARFGWSNVELRTFVPDSQDPAYWGTLLELLRIRMEHQLDSGQPTGLGQCIEEYPCLKLHKSYLTELAFEEFRLRKRRGDQVVRDEYAELWQIDVHDWPVDEDEVHLTQADWQLSMNSQVVASKSNKGTSITNGSKRKRSPTIPLRPAMLECGQVFGPFRVLAELGSGALARVYLAQQLDLSERPVVLKVCCQSTAEPQKIALLQHPNIVQILSLHEVRGYQVLCMPYVGATTLADLASMRRTHQTARTSRDVQTTVSNRQREIQTLVEKSTHVVELSRERPLLNLGLSNRWPDLPFENIVCQIIKQTADGLAQAHEVGIVHSDLKPANILLGDDGQARLVDFNVSQNLDRKMPPGMIGGTIPYMAPEHLESLRDNRWQAGPSSDLYSLGVLAFQLLSGKLPFRLVKGNVEQIAGDLIQQQRNSPPPRLPNEVASPDVASIIEKLMEPDIARRYQSAAELSLDLDRHLNNLPLRTAANRSPKQTIIKWIKRHPRISSAASVVPLSLTAMAMVIAVSYNWYANSQRTTALRQLDIFQRQAPEVLVTAVSVNAFPELRDSLPEQLSQLQTAVFGTSDVLEGHWRFMPRVERKLLAGEVSELANLTMISSAELAKPWRNLALQLEPSIATEEDNAAALKEATRDSFGVAIEHYMAGELDDSMKLLRTTLDDDGNQPAAWMLLGHCHARRKMFIEADQAYATSLALMPKQWRGWYCRGLAKLQLAQLSQRKEDYNEAALCFSRTLELRPSLFEALFNRAICNEQLGRLAEAVEDLNKTIQASGFPVRANLMLARIHGKLQQRDRAQSALRAAYEAKPVDAIDLAELGFSRIFSDPKQALSDLEQAYQLNPSDVTVLQNLAYLTMDVVPDAMQAEKFLDAWVLAAPKSAGAFASRGVHFARHGRFDSAVKDAEKAANCSPSSREWAQIASIYAMATAMEEKAQSSQNRAQSLHCLSTSLQMDWRLAAELAADPDMKQLAEDPEFRRIINTAMALRNL